MKSNFDFLNRYWPALAQIGATAEGYVSVSYTHLTLPTTPYV